jgi:hypothetical protein
MSNDAVQHRRTDDTRETGNTPSERSASPISNDTTNYENIESNGEPSGMDISDDSEPDEPAPERPQSARAWGKIYATELGKPTLYDGVGKEAHPIIIWDCGKGFGPLTYSFDDFMRLQDHQVVNIVLGIMTNSDDHKYPTSTFFIDDTYQRTVVKDRLNRAFTKRFQPIIIFAGDNEEIWKMSNAAESAEQAMNTPVWTPKARRKYTTWTSANLAVPPPSKIKEACVFADRFFKDDKHSLGRIHRVITFASNLSNCMMMRNILRNHVQDPSLINTFETLVNLMHTQLHFQDEHSVLTFATMICDQAVRLLSNKFDHWIPEAVRMTTSGVDKTSQDLSWKRSLHVGLIYPNEDLCFKERTNSHCIREIEEKANQIGIEGTIDFKKAMEVRAACDHLLYVNDWTRTCHEQEIYVDDVLALVERGKEIYGIDPPVDRSERTIKDGNTKRQLEIDGSTHTIRFCNNLHVNAETYNPSRTICLYCGGARHYTSDHFGYQIRGEAPKRGEVRFDMYTAGYRRFDNIVQSRAKHSFNHFVKPIDEPARKAYNKVVNQIDDTTNYPSLTREKTTNKGKKPLSYISPLRQHQPIASSSRQQIADLMADEDEDEYIPISTTQQRKPRFAARGESVRRFQSNRKNKKRSN